MPDIFIGEFGFDITPPILTDKFPADGAMLVPDDTQVSFTIQDPGDSSSGVDLSTVTIEIGGSLVFESSSALPGWVVQYTANGNGFDFVITKTTAFLKEVTYVVKVNASDMAAISNEMAEVSWSFRTLDRITEPPVLYADGGDRRVDLKWSLNPAVDRVRFELRRSDVAAPAQPTQGDLIYTGLDFVFADLVVENGVRYFYTLFVVTDVVDGEDVYVAYDTISSASARPFAVTAGRSKIEEYVPVRGEFGAAAAPVVPSASRAWGDIGSGGRIESDRISVRFGDRVMAPIDGVVHQRFANGVDIEGNGFRFSLRGFTPKTMVGSKVAAGENIGTASDSVLVFSIFKLPQGRYGLRTVRPARFYLEIEARDGRR